MISASNQSYFSRILPILVKSVVDFIASCGSPYEDEIDGKGLFDAIGLIPVDFSLILRDIESEAFPLMIAEHLKIADRVEFIFLCDLRFETEIVRERRPIVISRSNCGSEDRKSVG